MSRERGGGGGGGFVGGREKVVSEEEAARLERVKAEWLEEPRGDFDGRIPALIVENERRRLPLAMSAAGDGD